MTVESTRGDAYLSWEPKRWRHRLPEDYLASLGPALDSVFFAARFERGPATRGHVELMANPRTPPEAVAELVKTW